MSNAALNRKLQRLQGNMQGVGGPMPGSMLNPRAFLEDEQDRSRTYLAAELLKILAEQATPEGNLEARARQALAAATLIFPELPEEEVKP